MRSRGPMPSAFSPSTNSRSAHPLRSTTASLFLSPVSTFTLVRGTTVVVPSDRGAGWLTSGRSEMVTVRLPCATATCDTLHVATHYDDAGALIDDDAGSLVRLDPELLDLRQKLDHVAAKLGRASGCTMVEGSVGSAVSAPRKSLIEAAIALRGRQVGIAQSDSLHRTSGVFSLNSTSRSISAPLAIRPTVGTPRVILAASPSA